MNKVSFGELLNASYTASNLINEQRAYSISSRITVHDVYLDSVTNGVVADISTLQTIAEFSKYEGTGLTVSFNSETTDTEMKNVVAAISEFIADLQEQISSENPANL